MGSLVFKLPKPEEVSELPELERCNSFCDSLLISIVRTLEVSEVEIFELLELLRMCFLLNSVPEKKVEKKIVKLEMSDEVNVYQKSKISNIASDFTYTSFLLNFRRELTFFLA